MFGPGGNENMIQPSNASSNLKEKVGGMKMFEAAATTTGMNINNLDLSDTFKPV